MNKYTIGLDLGINNVGWAVYDTVETQVINKGVVRFEESSNAQDRRAIRGSRRLNKRGAHRVERIAVYLNNIGFQTKRTYEPELLEKRIKGLNEKLTEQEIVNILYYFAIHRGYIPFEEKEQDGNSERLHHSCENGEYPCQYIKRFFENNGKYRGQCEVIEMKDNIRELKAILIEQAKYYSQLTAIAIDTLCNIIQSKRKFWEGPGSAKENQLSPYGRYRTKEDLESYQQDANYHKYLYEILIGKCQLSMDRLGKMDNVAPSCNYFAEEFNFYNDFINMSVKTPSLLDEKFQEKVDKNKGKLKAETIQEFKSYILSSKSVRFDTMLKEILGLERKDVQGFRVDKNRNPEFSKFEFYKYVVKQFELSNLHPLWLDDEDKKIYNKIIYILTVAPSQYEIGEMLKDNIKEVFFTKEEIKVLEEIKQKKKPDLGYHSLSESILKKTLCDMKKTEYQLNFMQIMRRFEYEREMKEYFQNNYSNKTKQPFIMEDKYVDDLFTNPQVKKTLRKAIKVINAIIKKYGDYPETIVIESTTEMNNAKKREEIEKQQKKYEKLNNDAKLLLQINGYEYTSTNIEKVINWEETNHSCAYCGKPITLQQVIKTDREHILPKSQTMDSSNRNITCSCAKCNSEKDNRTPFYFLSNLHLYEDFKKRVKEFKMSEEKKELLLFEGDIEKYSLKFINRNLRDTAYGTVALIEELNKYNEYLHAKIGYKINIVSVPGQLTSKLRKELDQPDKNRAYLYHHAIDAMLLASVVDTKIGKILIQAQNDPQYWLKFKNKEHAEESFNYLDHVNLKNINQINQLNNECTNADETSKDNLINRSFEVKKNPLQSFANTNYEKYIKKGDQYYKISQISNIYGLKIRNQNGTDGKDKKMLDELFDSNNNKKMLLCEEKDKALYQKLKSIYNAYPSSENPFLEECIYANHLEEEKGKFEYLKHGIQKNENPNSPRVLKLRYIERVTFPYLKTTIKNMRMNQYGEFTINTKKENTLVGLNSIKQICTKIFYSYENKKFIFLPICSISFKKDKKRGTLKLDESEKFYRENYNRIIGKQLVKEIGDVYCGEWVKVIKKDGTHMEGRYSNYDKTNKILALNLNGSDKKFYITPQDIAIIIYTTDILGNRYVRLSTFLDFYKKINNYKPDNFVKIIKH